MSFTAIPTWGCGLNPTSIFVKNGKFYSLKANTQQRLAMNVSKSVSTSLLGTFAISIGWWIAFYSLFIRAHLSLGKWPAYKMDINTIEKNYPIHGLIVFFGSMAAFMSFAAACVFALNRWRHKQYPSAIGVVVFLICNLLMVLLDWNRLLRLYFD